VRAIATTDITLIIHAPTAGMATIHRMIALPARVLQMGQAKQRARLRQRHQLQFLRQQCRLEKANEEKTLRHLLPIL
jgi:hypothetical protein